MNVVWVTEWNGEMIFLQFTKSMENRDNEKSY